METDSGAPSLQTKMEVTPSSDKPPLDPNDAEILNNFLKTSKKLPKLTEYLNNLKLSKDYLKTKENLKTLKKSDANAIAKRTFLESWKLFEQFDKAYAVISGNTVKSVLDLGCNPGGYTQYVLDHNMDTSDMECVGYGLPASMGGLPSQMKDDKKFKYTEFDILTSVVPSNPKLSYDLSIIQLWTSTKRLEDYISSKAKESINAVILRRSIKKICFIAQLISALENTKDKGKVLLVFPYRKFWQEFYSSVFLILEPLFDYIYFSFPVNTDELCYWGTHYSLVMFHTLKPQAKDKALVILKSLLADLDKGKVITNAFAYDPSIKSTSSQDLLSQTQSKLASNLIPKLETLWDVIERQLKSFPPRHPFVRDIPLSSFIDPSTSHLYQYDADTNGIIYYLNAGNPRANCGITVTSSGASVGEALEFINREKVRCWTAHHPFAWYCVDLGEGRRVIPTHYSIGYASSGAACCMRNWILQGANQITRTDPLYVDDTPQNDPDWVTISFHNNDTYVNSEWGLHTYKLNSKQTFRYFRVVQTGPNCYNSGGGEDVWSQVLVAGRFEIYGYLFDKKDPKIPAHIPATTSPVYFGSSSTPTYKTPAVIRADPHVTREIQDLLNFLARPDGQQKPEKIRVHDIVLN